MKIVAARGAALTGESDNPGLLPAAGIAFSTTGGVRRVTLATVPSQIGKADVTLTVSDGAGTATVVIHTFAFGDADEGNVRDPKFGTLDSDLMLGRGGNDHLIAGTDDTKPPPSSTGRDTLCGGDGNDELEGQDEEDTVDGQAGNDSSRVLRETTSCAATTATTSSQAEAAPTSTHVERTRRGMARGVPRQGLGRCSLV